MEESKDNLSNPTDSTGPVTPATPETKVQSWVSEEQVWAALRECYDPEIPLNIVDLGLVYDVAITGSHVDIKMTLTAPGCPMSGMISADVQARLMSLGGVAEAEVEIVWDPPWHQSMISAEGRKRLGLE
jgi:metal-sulfur cluster biosynthetic enzyme